MTTRWFVEVSPVDADTLKERYCVEAIQWQQALQQARKIRGDRGPLSRFSIELLEVGYRATDPSSRIRYTVSKAPGDAPLTLGGGANGKERQPAATAREAPTRPAAPGAAHVAAPAAPSMQTATAGPAGAPVAVVATVAGAAPVVVASQAAVAPAAVAAPAGAAPAIKQAVPQGAPDAAASSARALHAPRPLSKTPGQRSGGDASAPRPAVRSQRPGVDHTAVASARATMPEETATPLEAIPLVNVHSSRPAPPEPSAPEPVFPLTAPVAVPSVQEEPAAVANAVAAQPEIVPSLPGLELIAVRREEPREGVPIVYREYAFAVSANMSPRELERYARAAWEQVRSALSSRTQGKFVQIAIFDHKFSARPERPPVAVLAWKDWRGDPVIQIRGPEAAPAPAAVAARISAPVAPAPAEPQAPIVDPGVAQPAAPDLAPAPVAAPVPIVEPAPVPIQVEAPDAPAEPSVSADTPSLAHALRPIARAVAPAAAPRRRGPNEDLISELFEEMHQLHFMPDLVAGADYVASVIFRVLPSEGLIVHVFDINTRNFVVVRAAGPRSADVLLHRTPDTFAHFREAFRRGRALAFTPEADDERVQKELWDRLGVVVQMGLCGAVQQAGRYLGIIELANPLGGQPFHVGELNALDYICEQFADFVAQKPIVLDADAVIPRQ